MNRAAASRPRDGSGKWHRDRLILALQVLEILPPRFNPAGPTLVHFEDRLRVTRSRLYDLLAAMRASGVGIESRFHVDPDGVARKRYFLRANVVRRLLDNLDPEEP